MADFRVEIPELDELMRQLDPRKIDKAFKIAVGKHAEDIMGVTKEYPPDSIANSPSNPSGRWYDRGYGQRWKGGGSRTSEDLGSKWYRKSKPMQEEIGNTASYAIYVQGRFQPDFHERRGWRRLDKEAANRLPRIERDLAKEVENQLAGQTLGESIRSRILSFGL